MRPLYTIETDISSQRKKSELLKKEKSETKYIGITEEIGKSIRAYVWGLIASFFICFEALLHFEYEIEHTNWADEHMCLIIASFFLLLSLIATVCYLRGSVSYTAAKVYTIISGIIFFVPSVDILCNLKGKSLIFTLFKKYQGQIIEIIGGPSGSIENIIKSFLYANSVLLIPVTIMFLGSTFKLLHENKKIVALQTRIAVLDEEISLCENLLIALNRELEETKQEAQQLFDEEYKKDHPNKAQIESLAVLGLPSAKQWVTLSWEQGFNEKAINNLQIIKESAMGYPEACMSHAMLLLLEYANDLTADDNSFPPCEDKKHLCMEIQPYLKKAADAGNLYGELYYLYATERLGQSDYKKYSINEDKLREMREKFKELKDSKTLDENATAICEQCIKRIDNALFEKMLEENRKELKKWSGFYRDIKSSGSSTQAADSVEFYYPIDVSGM